MKNISNEEELINFLETKTVPELKAMAKAAGYERSRYSKLRKPKLIELLIVPPKEIKAPEERKRMSAASFDFILEAAADMRKWKIYRSFNINKYFETLDVAE